MSSSMLDRMFPALPPEERRQIRAGNRTNLIGLRHEGGRTTQHVKTRWAAICSLELQGLNKEEIAERLGLAQNTVCTITLSERYINYREQRLAALDSEFFAMKPFALNALKGGLNSADENTALRASEQWFKAAGFGGFSRNPEPPSRVTAEDVVATLLNVNVNVNVDKS